MRIARYKCAHTNIILFLISFLFFAVDRLLKNLVINISEYKEMFLIPKILRIELYKNFGTAFGFKIPIFLIIFFSIIIIFLIVFLVKKYIGKKIPVWSFLFLILGAISNIYDRIFYGFVIDFFNFLDISFFNIADIMIIIGLIGIFSYWVKD